MHWFSLVTMCVTQRRLKEIGDWVTHEDEETEACQNVSSLLSLVLVFYFLN